MPRVVDVLHKALAWRAVLDSREVANQAEIARREGVTRARVTQVMGLLRLAPALQERILCMPKTDRWKAITERVLRPIARLECAKAQVGAFSVLLEATR